MDTGREPYDPQKRFELDWTAELVNTTAPNAALVSPSGYLVTLDEHAFLGLDHSVVVYGKKGELIKDFALHDLIPQEDIDGKITRSTSSRYWRHEARFFFCDPSQDPNKSGWVYPATHLYVLLKYGKAIEISLANGEHKYGDPSDFPYLDSLTKKVSTNEEHLVWATSIENVSITELLQCMKPR